MYSSFPTRLKIYFAGKVSPDSLLGEHWRDRICFYLTQELGIEIINLDPTKKLGDFNLNQNNSRLMFGRDCFMIKSADLVVTYLSDDISIGGSQEMLIAKYFHKPLVGIAPREGKFNKSMSEIGGQKYHNWVHPFVSVPCDKIVEDTAGLARFIRTHQWTEKNKTLSIIDNSVDYYQKEFFIRDSYLHLPDLQKVVTPAQKGVIMNNKKELLFVRYKTDTNVATPVRGKLGLAGGRSQFGETPRTSLIREVKEETGITIKPFLPFYSWSWKFERNHTLHQIIGNAWFGVKESGEIQPPYIKEEIDLAQGEWHSLEKINLSDLVREERPVIKMFLRYLKQNPFVVPA